MLCGSQGDRAIKTEMARSRTFRTEKTAAKYSFRFNRNIKPNDEFRHEHWLLPRSAVSIGKGRTIWAVALLLLLGACSSGSDSRRPMQDPIGQHPPVQKEPVAALATAVGDPLAAAVTQSIGSAGGTIESADGTLRIDVPAGALATEQIFSVQLISNHAHGKISSAFRLRPEGTAFAGPVRLTFFFTPEQITGTAPQLLRVASQNSGGFWELHEELTLDADAGTVSIETNHFSDWSLVTGALLSPQSAIVKPTETVSFSVVVCERVQSDDQLAPLIAECRPSEVIRTLTRNWSVNGTPGGDGRVGTIAVQEDRSAVYTAPANAPQPNTVAASTEYTTLQSELVTLVANVRVESGLCMPPSPAEPCSFNLAEFNGQSLPYEGLPREPWENPETVNSGRLSLWDFDGDGVGTWSLRIVWSETRLSGNLEQFEQLAGDFTSEPSGQLRFTVQGSGTIFTGNLQQSTVTIEGYPFSTNNVSVAAGLTFRR